MNDTINSTALYFASLAEVGSGRTLTRVEIAAVAWGVNIFSGIINTVGTKAIGRMSAFNVWWTLAGTVILAVVLLVKAPSLVCQLNLNIQCVKKLIVTQLRTQPSLCLLTSKSMDI